MADVFGRDSPSLAGHVSACSPHAWTVSCYCTRSVDVGGDAELSDSSRSRTFNPNFKRFTLHQTTHSLGHDSLAGLEDFTFFACTRSRVSMGGTARTKPRFTFTSPTTDHCCIFRPAFCFSRADKLPFSLSSVTQSTNALAEPLYLHFKTGGALAKNFDLVSSL